MAGRWPVMRLMSARPRSRAAIWYGSCVGNCWPAAVRPRQGAARRGWRGKSKRPRSHRGAGPVVVRVRCLILCDISWRGSGPERGAEAGEDDDQGIDGTQRLTGVCDSSSGGGGGQSVVRWGSHAWVPQGTTAGDEGPSGFEVPISTILGALAMEPIATKRRQIY